MNKNKKAIKVLAGCTSLCTGRNFELTAFNENFQYKDCYAYIT